MAASNRHRTYMLAVLALIYVFNGVDRSIMWVLLEPIKAALQLTDTELGWLSGFAFGVFYAAAGIPIGMLADRMDRRRIIAAAASLWSVMTAICGLATGFWPLFAARVAVGAAESGAPPASISFITDLYPRRSRTSAIAFYMSGSSVALIVTYAAGSSIAARFGWRIGFLMASIPGIILAFLVWFTFREPRRGGYEEVAEIVPSAALTVTLRYLMTRAPLYWMILAVTASAVASVGLSTFMASYLIRSHHLTLPRAGGLIALGHLFAAIAIPCVGHVADRLSVRDGRWTVWIPAIITGVGTPLSVTLAMTDSPLILYIVLPLVSAIGGSQISPVFSFLQTAVKINMRATIMSIAYVIQNLIGIGVGSVLVGMLSDHLKFRLGSESLRYSLAAVSGLFWLACLCYLRAASALRQDITPSDAEGPLHAKRFAR